MNVKNENSVLPLNLYSSIQITFIFCLDVSINDAKLSKSQNFQL